MGLLVLAGIGFILAGLLEFVLLYFLRPMLIEVGAVRKNYQGLDIPVSVGISLSMVILLVFCFFSFFSWYETSFHLFLIGIISFAFLGFIDDLLGQRDTLGFRGHFSQLFKGRLTTGGLKALGGGLVAFFVASFFSATWYDLILNTLIVALFANMLNLLDLRPGRAVKGFLFFLLLIIIIVKANISWLLLGPVLGAVLVYLPYDLKAQVMLGDTGSNVLGFILGFLSVIYLSLYFRMGILVFLILMHLYTEKYSLTKTIENNKLLKAIDNWGRG